MTGRSILQVDFKMDGPFGDEMAEAFTELAKSIYDEEGFIWKIWTENPETKEASGIYLFQTLEAAEKCVDMHTNRLADFGISPLHAKIFEVNSALTEINKGPVNQ